MTREYLIDYLDLLEDAETCEYLTPNEQDFIESLREKYEQYGPGTHITPAQIKWLEDITDRDAKPKKIKSRGSS